MKKGMKISIIGAGLAGSEAALQLAARGFEVRLFEMRPQVKTPVHQTADCAELVCSNSLKSQKPASAAGMLKHELTELGSYVFRIAEETSVSAGGALAVDRNAFSSAVTKKIENCSGIELIRDEVKSLRLLAQDSDCIVLASGPLTSEALAQDLGHYLPQDYLAFYDAAAPIVSADSLNYDILFRQNRYEDKSGEGDYWNAPFNKNEYENFIEELKTADRVILKSFESKDLFQACQPLEEIARKGTDACRFGPMKPVGLVDPHTNHRPWAALQLRAEDAHGQSYNLVGCQTNLTFPEQKRIFRLVPGLEEAEFLRYGVMHRNTFVDAPKVLDHTLCLKTKESKNLSVPLYIAGQLSGTEGYCEAIRSGLHAALSITARFNNVDVPCLPTTTVFGALIAYATNPETKDYQPMHVNFGLIEPLEKRIRSKQDRYEAYRVRAEQDLSIYRQTLVKSGLLESK
ncbi:MAG: methylenetetrahydrofolate--tRNA-(uracil(54)-C(5))-methyltransferase (FADH(2)-oxidizing) TrmFO [Eggerthellaceae bacterium]|jgi:methylenetetrahydrofolate--tRNA-(uracil-5-)-methyltransferase